MRLGVRCVGICVYATEATLLSSTCPRVIWDRVEIHVYAFSIYMLPLDEAVA
jgi:hypothetical protein